MGNGVGMAKCSKIRHIVRLRQMLRRWRMRAASASRGAPADVPAGHVAVCVGSSSRRFVVRAAHLNHPVFRQLLRQAEEEYGFSSRPGPLALPCDESFFEHILRHLSSSSSSSSRFVSLEDFRKTAPASSSCSCSCCHAGQRSAGWHSPESVPLVRAEKSVW
ncbi:indole-3-acetic acid-induced protein ARG7-like [Phoenix dactylifera]|uniref:Indole-3-acetic acid-induced protein ARG7-like n=1 Tax=Phoenix dactylifera TaxID=42345 RepID=A0A8B7CQ92_PHODC|nr:indole-3-acetic acid-induced protein ARG7-like [Phoenix dactylifera]